MQAKKVEAAFGGEKRRANSGPNKRCTFEAAALGERLKSVLGRKGIADRRE